MNLVWLSTGTNLGNRFSRLEKAAVLLEAAAGHLVQCSSVYETEPWGKSDQNWFLNQVLLLETGLPPEELLAVIRETEAACGRQRRKLWEAREMDVDILFYNDEVIDTPELKIPHPHMATRRFVLEPLAEISPEKIHPLTGQTVDHLLDRCDDSLIVRVFR